MGPLIPQNIINADLNFFFAFLIGIAFGFILEQAGFSSSRKLAGVFYGYDFVVLKVFFTAGFTAALGLFFFKYFGWIDFDFVFVNPLYLYSAIVGGVVMGFGFILGGFCPGTGFVAAVIGKIDAIIFVLGIFIGVFIFGYYFDFFQPIYNSNYLGNLFVYDSLGMSQKWFLFVLVIVAVVAFAVTQQIQNKSDRFKELVDNTQKISLTLPLVFLFVLIFVAILLPENRKSYLTETAKSNMIKEINSPDKYLSVNKIAHFIINDSKDLYLVDVRDKNEFSEFHLPGAVNVPLENILNVAYKPLLKFDGKKTVFYSNGGTKAEMAWFLLTRAGLGDFYVLEGGLNNFFFEIFENDKAPDDQDIMKNSEARFQEFARKFFQEGEIYKRTNTNAEVPKQDIKIAPAKGGC
jgi:rhodanese-related sulfurtransferase/uncharacterized membrane protein YedE/YeeE